MTKLTGLAWDTGVQPAFTEAVKEAPMLGTVAVWLVMAREKRGLLMLGALLLFMALATLSWNLIP
jgi:hypothetical protein